MRIEQIKPETIIELYRVGGLSPAVVLYLVPVPEIRRHCPEIFNPNTAFEMSRLIELISKRTEQTYIWTHYFAESIMEQPRLAR